MITIDLLKNHSDCIPRLTEIWREMIGKTWEPEVTLQQLESWCREWLNDSIPLALIALVNQTPVGMCSLQMNDGIRPDLKPWLGDLCVDPAYQRQGIGKKLIDTTTQKARDLKFENLYLYTFEKTLTQYYTRLGWNIIGMDEYKRHPVTVMELDL